MHDDVCTVVDGPDEVAAHAEGVVHDQGNLALVCDLAGKENRCETCLNESKRRPYLGYVGDGADVVFGVADTLDIDGLGILIDGRFESSSAILGDELDFDAKLLEHDITRNMCHLPRQISHFDPRPPLVRLLGPGAGN